MSDIYTDLKLYRSYVNDFLTVERFAEYYGFTLEEAHAVIKHGRKRHNAIAVHEAALHELRVDFFEAGDQRFKELLHRASKSLAQCPAASEANRQEAIDRVQDVLNSLAVDYYDLPIDSAEQLVDAVLYAEEA